MEVCINIHSFNNALAYFRAGNCLSKLSPRAKHGADSIYYHSKHDWPRPQCSASVNNVHLLPVLLLTSLGIAVSSLKSRHSRPKPSSLFQELVNPYFLYTELITSHYAKFYILISPASCEVKSLVMNFIPMR